MTFFDKIRDKTSEMLEISRLNNKINEEKRKISLQKGTLADLYWARFENGEELIDEAMACCIAIRASNEAIAAYNQEIIKLKEQPSQAVAAELPSGTPAQESIPCKACGSSVPLGKKFCTECGTPTAPPEPVEKEVPADLAEEPICCDSCGEAVPPGKKFCSECGAPTQSE